MGAGSQLDAPSTSGSAGLTLPARYEMLKAPPSWLTGAPSSCWWCRGWIARVWTGRSGRGLVLGADHGATAVCCAVRRWAGSNMGLRPSSPGRPGRRASPLPSAWQSGSVSAPRRSRPVAHGGGGRPLILPRGGGASYPGLERLSNSDWVFGSYRRRDGRRVVGPLHDTYRSSVHGRSSRLARRVSSSWVVRARGGRERL